MKGTKVKKGIGIALIAIFMILIIAVDFLCYQYSTVITRWWSGTFTKTNTEKLGYTAEEAKEKGAQLTQETEAEGAVLLKTMEFCQWSHRI